MVILHVCLTDLEFAYLEDGLVRAEREREEASLYRPLSPVRKMVLEDAALYRRVLDLVRAGSKQNGPPESGPPGIIPN